MNSTRLMCVPDSLASSVEVMRKSNAFLLIPGFSAILGRAEALLSTLDRIKSIEKVIEQGECLSCDCGCVTHGVSVARHGRGKQ